ncbi:hypothetical protein [Luteimonas sp. SDU82]
MKKDENKEVEARVLGHVLSKEEMDMVSGGDGDGIPTLPPVVCTPARDGVGDSERAL